MKRIAGLKKTFSYHIIRIFLVLFVLIWILFTGIYSVGHHILTNQISSMLYNNSLHLADTLQKEVERIQKFQYECLNDDILYHTVGAYSIMSKSEQIGKMLDIQERLWILQNSSPMIKEVIMYSPKIERKISSIKGVEKMEKLEGADKKFWEKIENNTIFYEKDSIYLGASYSHNVGSEAMFKILICLSNEAITREMQVSGAIIDGGIKLTDQSGRFELNSGMNIAIDTGEFQGKENKSHHIVNVDDGKKYIVLKTAVPYLDMDLYLYLSHETAYKELNIYRNIFSVCLLIMMFFIGGYIYFVHIVVNQPIKILVDHIERMEKGDLSVRIAEKREDEFGYVYVAFNRMVESLQNLIELNYKQKILTQKAELRHLQSQINPHFLYNSFFTIYRMAKDEDCDSIVEFSSYLSEYYRYITKSAQSEIPFKMEVEHARRYADIQAMRFRRRLKIKFEELPKEFENMKVPRLILQPLLENALEHGVNNMEKGGVMKIWFEQKEDKLFIHVEDNGTGMSEEEIEKISNALMQTGEMIENGLCNINRRLKIKFGEEYGIKIMSREGEGTLCNLILPVDGRECENV